MFNRKHYHLSKCACENHTKYKTYTFDIQRVRQEMTKFKKFREKVSMDFYFEGIIHSKILVGDKNLL
jgi:hypothetical protein